MKPPALGPSIRLEHTPGGVKLSPVLGPYRFGGRVPRRPLIRKLVDKIAPKPR